MKQSWSDDYLLRKHGSADRVHQWTMAKRREYEARTGVHWTSWSARGRRTFAPFLVAAECGETSDADMEKVRAAVLAHGNRYGNRKIVDFVKLALHTGFDLQRVMNAALGLVRAQRAWLDVSRTGRPVYLKVEPEQGKV